MKEELRKLWKEYSDEELRWNGVPADSIEDFWRWLITGKLN